MELEKIFANCISDNYLYPEYIRKSYHSTTKKAKNPILKLGKDFNRHF